MHSLFPVENDRTPLAPAMTWADNRATHQARELLESAKSHSLYLRTGCPLRSTYYPARLRWWLQTTPDLTRRAARFVALKDWILYHLNGVWATDSSRPACTLRAPAHRRASKRKSLPSTEQVVIACVK